MEFNIIVQYEDSYMSALKEISRILERLGDREADTDVLVPKFIAVNTSLVPKELVNSVNDMYLGDPESLSSTKRWIPVEVVCRKEDVLKNIAEYRDDLVASDRYVINIEIYQSDVEEDSLREASIRLLRGTHDPDTAVKFLYVFVFGNVAAISLLHKHDVFRR